MKVVLDSNIIVADFWMDSPGFKILLENAKTDNVELIIPKVVVDEVKNKFRQRINKSQSDINAEAAKLDKITRSAFGITVSKDLLEKSLKKYERYLKKTFRENNITVAPYPAVPHEYLAQKAMLKLKPFNENEKGYRDSLIWETIKTFLSKVDTEVAVFPELIFITNNATDFASAGKLHTNLLEELEEEEFSSHAVGLYTSLTEFNDKVAKLNLDMANAFEDQLRENKLDAFGFKELIEHHLITHFIGSDLHHYHGLAPYANGAPTVSGFEEDYKIEHLSVRKLNAREYVVDLTFQLTTELDYYIDKSDYYGAEDLNVFVIDADWNDHVVAVSTSVNIPIQMTLVVNKKLDCTSVEINKINDKYDYEHDEY